MNPLLRQRLLFPTPLERWIKDARRLIQSGEYNPATVSWPPGF